MVKETKCILILVTCLRKKQNVVLDDYRVSFVINTGIWLVDVDKFAAPFSRILDALLTLDSLNAWIIDKICNRKCGIRYILSHDHLHAIIEQVEENVKDDIPHCHKSHPEIHTESLPNRYMRYNWPMSAYASQAFSIAHHTDLEDLPFTLVGLRRDAHIY